MGLWRIGCDGAGWTIMAQSRIQYQPLEFWVLNIGFCVPDY